MTFASVSTSPRKLVHTLFIAAIALTIFVGFNSGAVDAKRSTSLTCQSLQAGYEYADRQSTVAGYHGDTAGVAAWNEVSGALGRIYLSMGCVTPDDLTV